MTEQLSDIAETIYSIFGSATKILLSGVLLIFLVWVSETWIKTGFSLTLQNNYLFKGATDVYLFTLGVLLIILSAVAVFVEWILLELKIAYYLWKYPAKSQDKNYYLIMTNGTGYLLDGQTKEIRWIENAITSADLSMGRKWTYFDKTLSGIYTQDSKIMIGLGKAVDLKAYNWGKGIRTRGIPGT